MRQPWRGKELQTGNTASLPCVAKLFYFQGMEHLRQHVESILFAADKPVSQQEIIDTLNNLMGEDTLFETAHIASVLNELVSRYEGDEYSFALVETGGGYQFLTKAAYHETVSMFLRQRSARRLSTAAMETLAIIAYKQPVTKSEMEQIRGVSCDYTINKLLEKDLINMLGRDEGPGKPILYGLSETFMDYFGINSVDELPKPKDIQPAEENTIGEPTES